MRLMHVLAAVIVASDMSALGPITQGTGGGAIRDRDSLGHVPSSSQWRPPVIDRTTSIGGYDASGDIQSQTAAWLDEGQRSFLSIPPCLGSGLLDAAAQCATLCVRLPDLSTVTRVDTLAFENGTAQRQLLPCDSKKCLDLDVLEAKAMFESGGTSEPEQPSSRLCRVFRNWHPERPRQGVLRVSFRLPTVPQLVAAGRTLKTIPAARGLPKVYLETIVGLTDVVVAGTVGRPSSYLSKDQRKVYTDYPLLTPTIYYDSALAPGMPNSATVRVTQLGGTLNVNGIEYRESHSSLSALQPGQRGLFLLERGDGKLWIAGEYYGAFSVVDGNVSWLTSQDELVPPIKAQPLETTIEMIMRELRMQGKMRQ